MAKKIDYTGETVKESISKTMEKVIAYHRKNWREGNELKVRDYAEDLCGEELLKYLSYSEKDTLLGPLYSYVQDTTSKKYSKIFERWLLQYGPYIMTLALEYASASEWRNRYLVSDERREQLIDEAYKNAMKGLKKIGLW
jgi:hypothetical protein